MQRFLMGITILPALMLLAGLTGCGKEEPAAKPKRTPIVGSDGGGGAVVANKPTIKPGTAKLVGRVVYDGVAPQPASLLEDMKKHNDNATCLAGKESEKIEQTWLLSKDGGVANVVIWVNPPTSSEFEVQKASGEAVLDQPHCVFVPHVLVVKPGQKLKVMNSAPVAHNTKLAVDTFVNKGGSPTIPPKGFEIFEFNPQDTPIVAGCDFHRWMQAKIWVSPHQFVAVTKDDGTFVIEGLPEGEFSIVAWHESPGFFYGGKKGTKTTIKAGENKLDLKVSAK